MSEKRGDVYFVPANGFHFVLVANTRIGKSHGKMCIHFECFDVVRMIKCVDDTSCSLTSMMGQLSFQLCAHLTVCP